MQSLFDSHNTKTLEDKAILLIQCEDQKGILAKVCHFLANHNANIVSLQEYADVKTNQFYCRVEWEMNGFSLSSVAEFNQSFHEEVGSNFSMDFRIYFTSQRPRVCVFVSKYSHCLEDLLYRHASGELAVDIPLIISNHKALAPIAKLRNIPFHYFKMNNSNKQSIEKEQRKLIEETDCDVVVLARYMQILSAEFVQAYKNRIINIHHSFLPAFTGAKPYHAAHKRGVKVIGATAHFVTEQLDEGPIICQDVTKITHKDSVQDMVIKGRDTEKQMLSKAVKLFCAHKVITGVDQRTIVFD